jgi:hypothetical protein
MSWERSRRLDFIAWRLTVHGSVRRQHISDTFAVSESQASQDIQLFIAEHPSAIVYDKNAKQYVPADNRARVLRGWTPDALSALRALARAGHEMAWQ